MARPMARRSVALCQVCDLVMRRQFRLAAKPPLHSARSATTARLRSKPDQCNVERPGRSSFGKRWMASTTAPKSKHNSDQVAHHQDARSARLKPGAAAQELSSLINMMTYLENNKTRVMAHRGIPSEQEVKAALLACQVVANYIMDDSVKPQINHLLSESTTSASNLLDLDAAYSQPTPAVGGSRQNRETSSSPTASQVQRLPNQLEDMIDKISKTAYEVLVHPPVLITPSLLQQYVDVQARLGTPESLPKVFQLYASKPVPKLGRPSGSDSAGAITFFDQKPNRVAAAINPDTVNTALDTAIAAKNLDAAVGVIEHSYTTKAFTRSKLLQRCLVPAGLFGTAPLAAYLVASNIADLQQTMDRALATNVAFTGILAYVGFTASIGLVALTTANDQMKRVTWAPGVPLRMRWIREEERAALDKVACAWGFREQWRQGEEEGPDWDALKEYLGHKGMILDRTELMEGMS